MERNRQRVLYFSENWQEAEPLWLPLSAGITQRNMSRNSEKQRFYSVGQEENPLEEVQSGVKLITLRGVRKLGDAAQERILSLHGERVALLDWEQSENGENKGIFCFATVEVMDDGSGKAEEERSIELRLHCGRETSGRVSSTVNGITFTV